MGESALCILSDATENMGPRGLSASPLAPRGQIQKSMGEVYVR